MVCICLYLSLLDHSVINSCVPNTSILKNKKNKTDLPEQLQHISINLSGNFGSKYSCNLKKSNSHIWRSLQSKIEITIKQTQVFHYAWIQKHIYPLHAPRYTKFIRKTGTKILLFMSLQQKTFLKISLHSSSYPLIYSTHGFYPYSEHGQKMHTGTIIFEHNPTNDNYNMVS